MSAPKIALATLLLLALPAFAQDKADPDLRVLQAAVDAANALLKLRDTELTVLRDKLAKRETEWAKYSEPLWKEPDK